MVISLVAKGLTTGEVQAHLAEIYGAEVSRETISTITDRVLGRPGPHRPGTPALVQPVERRPERLRHHLRRPPQRRTQVTHQNRITPLS